MQASLFSFGRIAYLLVKTAAVSNIIWRPVGTTDILERRKRSIIRAQYFISDCFWLQDQLFDRLHRLTPRAFQTCWSSSVYADLS